MRILTPSGVVVEVSLDDPRLVLTGYLQDELPVPVTFPITRNVRFRSIPPITEVRWQEILDGAHSPLRSQASAIHAAAGGYITQLGAFMAKETEYGKTMRPGSNNPYNLGPGLAYRNVTDATKAARLRFEDRNYKNGVYPWDATLEEVVVIYQGGPLCRSTLGVTCANGETWIPGGPLDPDDNSVGLAIAQMTARINRFHNHPDPDPHADPRPDGDYVAHTLAGSSSKLLLPSGIPFRQQLTTVRPNRTGKTLNWTGTTQHTTNNPRAGTGAQMHANWQSSGTPGHPDGAVSVHFYVDDGEIIQTLPVNEQGIHSGDWRNQQHTAVERTTNAGINVNRANANAIALQAGLLHILGRSAESALYPHTTNARGHCPALGIQWDRYESLVDAAIEQIERES